jgi:outer membrane protein TolC
MTLRELLLPVGALLLGIGVAGGAGRPALAAPPDGPSSDSSVVVEALVAEALRSNQSLRQHELELDRARAALAQARGQYLPRLDVEARYSRAEGGRTIDFPVGDLLNPAYRTLNDLTERASFPEVDNQEIRFLREREQETALRLRQPLFNPEIVYGARARRHQVDAQAAAVEAFRRELVRDVRVAYFEYRTAAARVDILEATRALVRENRRVSERLRAAAKATPEAVYRAEVEVLAVRQRLDAARAGADRARRYLNVLRNRPADAPIPAPRVSEEALTDRFVAAVRRELGGALPSADAGAGPGRPGEVGVAGRPELARLAAAVEAAEAQRRAAQTAYLPTVSLAVDAGIQGSSYGVTGDQPFVLGSVVLRWNLFDGLQDRREVERRQLEAEALRARREEVAQQLDLELRTALDDVQVARRAVETAEARVRAARESFRLARRRYEEGRAPIVDLTDARTARTEAELNANVTRYGLLIELARLSYAAGAPPKREA